MNAQKSFLTVVCALALGIMCFPSKNTANANLGEKTTVSGVVPECDFFFPLERRQSEDPAVAISSAVGGWNMALLLAICREESGCRQHSENHATIVNANDGGSLGAMQIHPSNFAMCGGRMAVETARGNVECAMAVLDGIANSRRVGKDAEKLLAVYNGGWKALKSKNNPSRKYARRVLKAAKGGRWTRTKRQ